MPFKSGVDRYLPTLPPTSYDYKILKYLRQNAIGAANAKSWPTIQAALSFNDSMFPKQHFQHGVVKTSRSSDFFICSTSKGFYIPDTIDDVRKARHYYEEHVDSMIYHLDNLVRQANANLPGSAFASVKSWVHTIWNKL